jgi:hypothetical protein
MNPLSMSILLQVQSFPLKSLMSKRLLSKSAMSKILISKRLSSKSLVSNRLPKNKETAIDLPILIKDPDLIIKEKNYEAFAYVAYNPRNPASTPTRVNS